MLEGLKLTQCFVCHYFWLMYHTIHAMVENPKPVTLQYGIAPIHNSVIFGVSSLPLHTKESIKTIWFVEFLMVGLPNSECCMF